MYGEPTMDYSVQDFMEIQGRRKMFVRCAEMMNPPTMRGNGIMAKIAYWLDMRQYKKMQKMVSKVTNDYKNVRRRLNVI